MLFRSSVPIKDKILLENAIVNKMSSSKEQSEKENLQTVDALTYKLFVKKFNEQYGENLLDEQKDLITKYVMSFADNGIEFKLFLNEELERIKLSLSTALNKKEVSADHNMSKKTGLVIEKINNYKQKPVDLEMIKEVLKIQTLIKEINSEETL